MRTCFRCNKEESYIGEFRDFGVEYVCPDCEQYYDFCREDEGIFDDDREPEENDREATLAEYSRWEPQ